MPKIPKAEIAPASRDYTIVLHKLCQKTQFKKKAPKALKVVREFARKAMRTPDVRVDVKLNQYIWHHGVRAIPKRIRVRCIRRKDDDDESGNKYYTLVQLIKVESFKDLRTNKNANSKTA